MNKKLYTYLLLIALAQSSITKPMNYAKEIATCLGLGLVGACADKGAKKMLSYYFSCVTDAKKLQEINASSESKKEFLKKIKNNALKPVNDLYNVCKKNHWANKDYTAFLEAQSKTTDVSLPDRHYDTCDEIKNALFTLTQEMQTYKKVQRQLSNTQWFEKIIRGLQAISCKLSHLKKDTSYTIFKPENPLRTFEYKYNPTSNEIKDIDTQGGFALQKKIFTIKKRPMVKQKAVVTTNAIEFIRLDAWTKKLLALEKQLIVLELEKQGCLEKKIIEDSRPLPYLCTVALHVMSSYISPLKNGPLRGIFFKKGSNLWQYSIHLCEYLEKKDIKSATRLIVTSFLGLGLSVLLKRYVTNTSIVPFLVALIVSKAHPLYHVSCQISSFASFFVSLSPYNIIRDQGFDAIGLFLARLEMLTKKSADKTNYYGNWYLFKKLKAITSQALSLLIE